MQSQIICQNCNQQYRDDNLPRLLVACGHTFCQTCLTGFIDGSQQDGDLCIRCPEDGIEVEMRQYSVAKLPKNLALIKVIQAKKNNLSFKENQINVSKITKNSEVLEEQDTKQLISIMIGNKTESCQENSKEKIHYKQKEKQKQKYKQKQKQKSKQRQKVKKSKSPKQNKQQICPLHKKPMDIVCIVDLKKICASCAIFGEHRNHTFKSLQEVSQIQNQYCDQITSIINQKQKISQQICCSQTKNDILSILDTKKTKLKTKILEQFKKVETKTANKKKQILKKLDQIVKKQQNNLKNCMKFDESLVNCYQQWYKKSSSQLKVLEESDFQSKLILLFEGKNIDGDLVEEGVGLIEQMKVSEESILSEVEKKLQNLNINVNQTVYQELDSFIQVFCQSQKKATQPVVKNQPQIVQSTTTHQIPLIDINYNSVNGQRKLQTSKVEPTERQKRKMYTSNYNSRENSCYLQVSHAVSNALDQSLLQNDQDFNNQPYVDQFALRMSTIGPPPSVMNYSSVPLTQRFSIQPNIQTPIEKPSQTKPPKISKIANQNQNPKTQKLNKKKLKMMKLPQRYQKILQSLLTDTLQILDLTNAQIGDPNTCLICQHLPNSKVRTLKLIRNKLTDEGISKIFPYLGQITTLNLSQNLITENILDILYENKKYLGALRTVILSQNKITERKNKGKIDKLRKFEWNVSI